MAQKYNYPLNKSKGILDDFAVRKSVQSRELEIQNINQSGNETSIGGDIILDSGKSIKWFDDNTGWTASTTLGTRVIQFAGDGADNLLSSPHRFEFYANANQDGTGLWDPYMKFGEDGGILMESLYQGDAANRKLIIDCTSGVEIPTGQLDLNHTVGSIPFHDAGGLQQDNANLFWDAGRRELQPYAIKITNDGSQAYPALMFNDTNTGFFKSGDSIRLSINNSTKLTVLDNGRVGIGTTSPNNKLHVDNGQSKFDKGGGGAVASFHNGGSNNIRLTSSTIQTIGGTNDLFIETGRNIIMANAAGNVGIGTTTPTTKLSVNEKSGNTPIGGFCIKLTNKTGDNSIKGQLVKVYTTTAIDDAFDTQDANGDNTIGIVLDAGIADGSEAWIVVSGIADVLMDAGGSARGDRIISSATAGSGDVWNVGGAVATHFLEIGHCIENRTGAGLARCVLHFN